jgi:hypothetical protein
VTSIRRSLTYRKNGSVQSVDLAIVISGVPFRSREATNNLRVSAC